MKRRLRQLATWATMPGDDFDKPWANWMLLKAPSWVYGLWTFCIEDPLLWLCCSLCGHDFRHFALNGDVICAVCMKGSDEPSQGI